MIREAIELYVESQAGGLHFELDVRNECGHRFLLPLGDSTTLVRDRAGMSDEAAPPPPSATNQCGHRGV